MIHRRAFLGTSAAGILSGTLLSGKEPSTSKRKKLAIITTEWRYRSHGLHMGDRFLVGYPLNGRWHRPALDVVSVYVDQTPAKDLSREREKEFGFKIYPTIAETLRCGGDRLAVDAVLVIGEHGDYPQNEIGQKLYPRYEFFKQATDVFRKDGRSVPMFNDKHLSWNYDWAKEMVATSQELKFALSAGSSTPVTWRMPSIDLPYNAELEEILCVGIGAIDVYDFHCLEAMQSMAERRRGGETGVVAIQALQGDAVWKAMEAGKWEAGGWDPRLFESCLSRSQSLAQAPNFSHRYPTTQQMREWVKQPIAYRFEYADGVKATMLLMSGLVGDISVATRLKGVKEPLSTMFYLPPGPNVAYSAALMSKAEETFVSGKAPNPIERTLLTSGLVAAGMKSLATGEIRIETPHLNVRYKAPKDSTFWQS